MISFLKLIRYKNLFMVLLTMVLTKYALIQSYIYLSYLSNLEFITLVLSVVLITAGGYIINDIFDIEADKINKPNKVFIESTISLKNAWISYFFLTFFGLILGICLSFLKEFPNYSFVFLGTVFGLFLYSKFLKRLPLIGNLVVSFFIGLTIYIVYIFDFKYIPDSYLSFDQLTNSVFHFQVWVNLIIYVFFAFIINLVREIIKDIEDINGDNTLKIKTLPILFGRKRAKNIAVFISLILLISLIQISKNHIYNFPLLLGYCFIAILAPLSYFIYRLWIAKTKKHYSFLSNLMKVIMFFGILSMLLFKFQ